METREIDITERDSTTLAIILDGNEMRQVNLAESVSAEAVFGCFDFKPNVKYALEEKHNMVSFNQGSYDAFYKLFEDLVNNINSYVDENDVYDDEGDEDDEILPEE